MAYNKILKKDKLSKITKNLIKRAIYECYKNGITSTAPLGYSGDDIILFGNEFPKRESLVSIRNYCGSAELLITDQKGRFLFYGRFDINMGVDFIADQYWEIFKTVKPHIKSVVQNVSDFKNLKKTAPDNQLVGFKQLKFHQNKTAQQIAKSNYELLRQNNTH